MGTTQKTYTGHRSIIIIYFNFLCQPQYVSFAFFYLRSCTGSEAKSR